MKKRIIISVSSDLCTDQRVLKFAHSCFHQGYDVLLIGRELKQSLPLTLSFPHKRLRLLFHQSVLFYAEFNIRLFWLLLFSKADLYIANDTDTLLANYFAATFRGKNLLFDAHELFPEVPELKNRPFVKKIWTKIEDFIFPKLTFSTTVCDSIAQYYKHRYHISMTTIRNVPLKKKEATSPNWDLKENIILYQGVLNVGRGLEWVIDAMQLIPNARLLIIGDGDIKAQLEEKVQQLKLKERVTFLGRINAEMLHTYTHQAKVGLCLLEERGLNYYYALPNRVFDYIHAGIPILASDFPEIRNIVSNYNTGVLINDYSPEFLAKQIQQLLQNAYPTAHFKELSAMFCWEKEEKLLLKMIKNALA